MAPRAGWSDLPDDLIGDILHRLPSFADRAQLHDVCRHWRSAWRAQPHPAAPWHPDPGRCVMAAMDGGGGARVPLPADARNAVCRGALRDWLALVPAAPAAPFLLNAFTLDRVPLPAVVNGGTVRKVVLLSTPGATGVPCVVAAAIDIEDGEDDGDDDSDDDDDSQCTVAVFRPGQVTWKSVALDFYVDDIAFHQGELYLLDGWVQQLHRVAVGGEGGMICGDIEHCSVERVRLTTRTKVRDRGRYLVELDGDLLMVRRFFDGNCTQVRVFALSRDDGDDGGGARRRWVSGVSLDGRVLVVGTACCGAFDAASGDDDDRRICFVDGDVVDWSCE